MGIAFEEHAPTNFSANTLYYNDNSYNYSDGSYSKDSAFIRLPGCFPVTKVKLNYKLHKQITSPFVCKNTNELAELGKGLGKRLAEKLEHPSRIYSSRPPTMIGC